MAKSIQKQPSMHRRQSMRGLVLGGLLTVQEHKDEEEDGLQMCRRSQTRTETNTHPLSLITRYILETMNTI
jgi:hypothetical protein